MSAFGVGATVRTERGYELRFDLWNDAPYPREYRLDGFRVSEQRVPEDEKNELHGLAWDAWRHRGQERN